MGTTDASEYVEAIFCMMAFVLSMLDWLDCQPGKLSFWPELSNLRNL